jgi:hypothetical protein
MSGEKTLGWWRRRLLSALVRSCGDIIDGSADAFRKQKWKHWWVIHDALMEILEGYVPPRRDSAAEVILEFR